ncbi:MAG: 4'-phosphopantetheinyl transferase superfamily protein [Lachnospiraceae bacterium]
MIKVYIASTTPLCELSHYDAGLKTVSTERKKKIEQCRQAEDKRRGLLASLLLQYAWDEWTGTKEELREAYGEHGKPYCVNDSTFHYNLSHSGNYAVCAVASAEVGIDIQKKRPYQAAIARRWFAPIEYQRLEVLSGEKQTDAFCRIWTSKESYVKYTGKGMQQELQTFYEEETSGILCDNMTLPMDEPEVQSYSYPKLYVTHYVSMKDYDIAVCSEEQWKKGLQHVELF